MSDLLKCLTCSWQGFPEDCHVHEEVSAPSSLQCPICEDEGELVEVEADDEE